MNTQIEAFRYSNRLKEGRLILTQNLSPSKPIYSILIGFLTAIVALFQPFQSIQIKNKQRLQEFLIQILHAQKFLNRRAEITQKIQNITNAFFSRNKIQQMLFIFILHQDYYPFEPPYITLALRDHWPRVDDGRNYFYDIMRTDWWPLVSLKDIISELPSFAFSLKRSLLQIHSLGQFQSNVPLYWQDLTEMSPHILPLKLLVKESVFSSYILRWVHFTFSGIVLLQGQSDNILFAKGGMQVEDMARIESKQEKKSYKIMFESQQGTYYKIKWQNISIPPHILIIQLYYQAKVQELKEGKARVLIDTYNQIIVEAHHINLTSAVEWAKRKIIALAPSLS